MKFRGNLDAQYVNVSGDTITGALTITESTTANALEIDQNGNVGGAVATDGAVHIENTGNTGIGLGVYTNIGATADAELVSIKVDNVAFDQKGVVVDYDGTQTGVQINAHTGGNNALGQALTVTYDGSTSTGGWPMIYFDNNHTGAPGVRIDQAADNYALYINHGGNNNSILIDNPGMGDFAIKLSTGKYGIGIDADTGAGTTGTGILEIVTNQSALSAVKIDDNNTGTVPTIEIDKDGNSASRIFAIQIDVDNAGAGGVGGIDFSGMATGDRVFKFVADANDPTSGGGAATGRVAIDIGGNLRYLAYY